MGAGLISAAAGAPSREPTPTRVVRAYLDALAAADVDAATALVTDDFHNEHTSGLATSCHGREEYRRRLPGFLARFAGLRYEVEDVVAHADKVVVAYRMTAEWSDDAGRAHPLAIRGVFRFRVRDGLIAHRADYWDGTEFLRQTGQT